MMIYTLETLRGNSIDQLFSLNILPQLVKTLGLLQLLLGITFCQEVKIHSKL